MSRRADDLKEESPYNCSLCDRAFPVDLNLSSTRAAFKRTKYRSENYSIGFITDCDHFIP